MSKRNQIAATLIAEIVRSHKRGRPRALAAACTVSPLAIRAVLQQAAQDGMVALIESTANQVNPTGGYSGLTPDLFHRMVVQLARSVGMPENRLILGGDHIGPYPWRHLKADQALAQAAQLAATCGASGYQKLHLDTSSPCVDDRVASDGTLPLAVVYRRSALLCRETEQAARSTGWPAPWYVIGSDVPPPGGQSLQAGAAPVSPVQHVRESLSVCRRVFRDAGLEDAWRRVAAIVVHTGADFSPVAVQPYNTQRMQPLAAYLRQEKQLVFEAHATDFQAPSALVSMVADHCGILKVGPALTYAMREALFSLADMEETLIGEVKSVTPSRLPDTMERLMLESPVFWQTYYQGSLAEQKRLRRSAFSDRIRYYWDRPAARRALQRLMANLRKYPPPLALLEKYLPDAARKVRQGHLENDPEIIVVDRIADVAKVYAQACRAWVET